MTPVAEAGDTLGALSRAGLALAPALPQAMGEDGPAGYLLCALNDAELFGSGGAPLDVAMFAVDRGVASQVTSGSVAGELNPDNEPYAWPVKGGAPWYRKGREYPFANSNLHPNFPFSGANIRSAWVALDQPDVIGVLTVDMSAVAELLRVTGPMDSGEYGHLSADNVVYKVLVEAYRRYPEDQPGAKEHRRAMNAQLRADLINHLTTPSAMLKAMAALEPLFAARHIQAYMTVPGMQEAVVALGADGTLATPAGDISGVFLQSGVSKLAVFQRRHITHEVLVGADGSAEVTQTVTATNAVPEGLPGDPTTHSGYLALIFRQRVAYRLPAAATDPEVTQSDDALVPPERQGPYDDQAGAQVMWVGQDIPPGRTSRVRIRYRLPAGTFGTGDRLNYRLTANPQAMVLPVELEVRVRFAQGVPRAGHGWEVAQGQATWRGVLNRTVALTLSG
jgi:hypothetical protein